MEATPILSHKEFLLVDHDYRQAATAAHLVYVSDSHPGIVRLKKGKGFSYTKPAAKISARRISGPGPGRCMRCKPSVR